MPGLYSMSDLLALMEKQGAQELRIEAGTPPVLFVKGRASPLEISPLASDDIQQLFRSFATPEQIRELQACGDVRFLYSSSESARFNIAASLEGEQLSLQIRNLRI